VRKIRRSREEPRRKQGADDRLGLVSSQQVVRLHRTCIVLAVRSSTNKRACPVDLQSGISVDHRGADYSLSAPTVMLLA
jgi:hypothetical protein